MTGNSNTAAPGLAALALVLALAVAAPSDALVIPDGIATSAANFERTSPAAVAASPGGPRRSVAAPSSESGGNPILWFTDYFVPVVPEVGGKRAFTLSVVNLGGKTIAKGAVVIIWANRTVPVVCGVSGADADAEYKLPEIPPFKTVTLKVKVPYTSDPIKANSTATMRIFVDATFERPSLTAVADSPLPGRRGPLGNAAPSSFDGNPLAWWTSHFIPLMPEAGGKRKFTLWIVNVGDKTIPKGTVVSLWANRTLPAACGVTGADAEYKLPEIVPFKTIALKLTVPYTSDAIAPNAYARMRLFVDSKCSAFNSSFEDQAHTDTYVVEKGTDYSYLVAVELGPDNLPFGLESVGIYDTEPKIPITNGLFTASFGIQNIGTATSPEGVKVEVWPKFQFGDMSLCNNTGGLQIDIPKIGAGKSKTIVAEGLKAPPLTEQYDGSLVFVLVDSECKTNTKPSDVAAGYYDRMPSSSAYFAGVQAKGQLAYSIKTTPKAPKPNTTMTIKAKFMNWGNVEGAIGQVGLWVMPVEYLAAPLFGGAWYGNPCAYTGLSLTADFSDVVVKPGKSKTIQIKDVRVPAVTPGWYQVSILADTNCTLPASSWVLPWAAYAAFEIVAP
ncbi:hypothetical protein Rsub_13191 [Raphidocelis subcapitata]|uniref:CARDB domain-containing protein n=1 Tax=Raphidocelis subcapitata TaxID=307507 RepID=A0A2V0PQP3_9CHLO|nr:hypothetical protein Rsub_13191 [Raphidocelis subcapitata]|eukprot:GBG00514.1 hypothetical protein Rsub_13191 [Raphidocelis subcapitata]